MLGCAMNAEGSVLLNWLTRLWRTGSSTATFCLCVASVFAEPEIFINGTVDHEMVLWDAGHVHTFADPEDYTEIQAPSPAGWDLNPYVALAVDLENTGDRAISVLGKINHNMSAATLVTLNPGEADTMLLYLFRKQNLGRFQGMNSAPGGDLRFWGGYDEVIVGSLQFVPMGEETVGGTVSIKQISGYGKYGELSPATDTFFPFIDRFGQYMHDDWNNKVHSTDELHRFAEAEAAFLETTPRVENWSRFGGWKDGHKLEATGHFRTEKHAGKWWLVDPEGYLFWSIGVNGLRYGTPTPTRGREEYFSQFPEAFHDDAGINFPNANMALKYGAEWETHYAELCHQRLSAWGMNTAGNWSSQEIYRMQKTPYVVAIGLGPSKGDKAIALRGDEEALRIRVKYALDRHTYAANDPWCIGYFVDNELKWDYVPDIEMYYRVVHEEMRKAAPNKLYLGSRIHNNKQEALAASAQYCDVISINCYAHEPIATTHDKPYIIGEFHFGALDRGLCSAGLRSASNQRQRARSFQFYMRESMKRSNIIGAHWFTFREQAYTGRGDGENFQVGLVDVCDTPYIEMTEAIRETAEAMYEFRNNYLPKNTDN